MEPGGVKQPKDSQVSDYSQVHYIFIVCLIKSNVMQGLPPAGKAMVVTGHSTELSICCTWLFNRTVDNGAENPNSH